MSTTPATELIERRCGHAEEIPAIDRDRDFYATPRGSAQLRHAQARLCKRCKARLSPTELNAYQMVERAVARLENEW